MPLPSALPSAVPSALRSELPAAVNVFPSSAWIMVLATFLAPAAASAAEAAPAASASSVAEVPVAATTDVIFANRILALGDGPLGTVSELQERLGLPPTSRHVLPSSSPGILDFALPSTADATTGAASRADGSYIRFTLLEGTWESPRGNSPPRAMAPLVAGVELLGTVGTVGTVGVALPAGTPTVVSAQPRDLPGRQRSLPGLTLPGREQAPAMKMAHWSPGLYVHAPMSTAGSEGPPLGADVPPPALFVARFEGRAPWHYSDAERLELETVLISLTAHLDQDTASLAARLATVTDSRRRIKDEDLRKKLRKPTASVGVLSLRAPSPPPPPPLAVYDFGVGTITVVQADYVVVETVGPVRLPGFFQAAGITEIRTSFAHDAGQMVEPARLDGWSLSFGSYFIRRPDLTEDEDGEAAKASIRRLGIARVPGQKGVSFPGGAPRRR